MMQSVKDFYESKDLGGVPKRNTHDIGDFNVFFLWQLDENLEFHSTFSFVRWAIKLCLLNCHVYIAFVLQYCDKYADLIGVPHLEEWRKELCMAAIKRSEVDLETHRDYSYDQELLQLPPQYRTPSSPFWFVYRFIFNESDISDLRKQ